MYIDTYLIMFVYLRKSASGLSFIDLSTLGGSGAGTGTTSKVHQGYSLGNTKRAINKP